MSRDKYDVCIVSATYPGAHLDDPPRPKRVLTEDIADLVRSFFECGCDGLVLEISKPTED